MNPDDIRDGLKAYAPIEKRWQIEKVGDYQVINDAYNANPDSMKAALATVLELYPKATLVLGNMGELGTDEEFYHQEIGNFIIGKLTENNDIRVITVGNLAKKIAEKVAENGIPTASFENNCQATRYILDNVEKHSTIFLKASRSMKFEEILNELKGEISW